MLFLNVRIESTPESISSIGRHYGVNGKSLSYQYKEFFSDYRQWKQLDHALEYILFPENIGAHLCIDESCLSCGEQYTFVTNPEGHGVTGTLVAVIQGTKSENVIAVLEKIRRSKRLRIKQITLDLSPTMMLIARKYSLTPKE